MTTRMGLRGAGSWTAVAMSAAFAFGASLSAQTPAQGAQNAAAAPKLALTTQQPVPPQGAPVLQLSMEQAVQMAVDTNLGLKANRLNVDIAAEATAGAEGAFKPVASASTFKQNSTRLPSSFTDLTSGSISTASVSGGASVSQLMPWFGGQYSASWNNNRLTTTQPQPVFNPQLSSQVQFSYTQPLLRGFLIDSSRAALANSQTQQQVADLDLQLKTITLQNSVRLAYLNLKAAKSQLDVAQKNLELAQQSLREDEARVKVGVSAPSDTIQDQVAVKSNEGFVVQAQGFVESAQDQLRTLILDPNRPDYWTVQIDAIDELVVEAREPDVEAAVKNALANRLDVQEAQRSLEITHRTTRLDENLTKAAVNAIANYSATSSGGTQFSYSSITDTVGTPTTRSLGSVLGQTFAGDFPSWSVGVQVQYPIGRSTAEANLAQQRLNEQQAQINLRALQLQVAAAVRQAARDVKNNYQVVQTTRAALDAAQKQLDDENRKNELGLSNTFILIQKQQILANARISSIGALVSYNQALLNFERVQRVQ